MKTTKALLTAALVIGSTACGKQAQLSADEARQAMPSSDQAQIATPGGSALTTDGSSPSSALTVSTRAEYATDTLVLSSAVNGSVASMLLLVSTVVQLPPTGCADDSCTWGPWSASALAPNEFELVVTKEGDHHYTWALQGRSKGSTDFLALVSGEAFTTDVRYVGHGTLLIDLDKAASLHEITDGSPTGTISAAYDNTSGKHLTVQFVDTQDMNVPSQKVNAAYQFSETSDGGDLQVATRNLTTGATLALHSRWTATGAGRGDAQFDGDITLGRSQCWSDAPGLDLVFQVTDPVADSDTGDVSACAFATAELPTITIP
jgi:hypothetical protein